jgi:predicted Holliday junction resolvase-like endonuclease
MTELVLSICVSVLGLAGLGVGLHSLYVSRKQMQTSLDSIRDLASEAMRTLKAASLTEKVQVEQAEKAEDVKLKIMRDEYERHLAEARAEAAKTKEFQPLPQTVRAVGEDGLEREFDLSELEAF